MTEAIHADPNRQREQRFPFARPGNTAKRPPSRPPVESVANYAQTDFRSIERFLTKSNADSITYIYFLYWKQYGGGNYTNRALSCPRRIDSGEGSKKVERNVEVALSNACKLIIYIRCCCCYFYSYYGILYVYQKLFPNNKIFNQAFPILEKYLIFRSVRYQYLQSFENPQQGYMK